MLIEIFVRAPSVGASSEWAEHASWSRRYHSVAGFKCGAQLSDPAENGISGAFDDSGPVATAGKAVRLVALVESTLGLTAINEITLATPRLAAIMLGAADMAADLGADAAWEPLLHARSQIVAACARHDVLALDAPFFDIRDPEGLKQEIARSRSLGFAAKAAIHPTQVPPINAALTPSVDAIAEARAILAENANGVGIVNGRMIDEAVARKARRTLIAAGPSV
jgi:(S)-citramalyl-CoA lyase